MPYNVPSASANRFWQQAVWQHSGLPKTNEEFANLVEATGYCSLPGPATEQDGQGIRSGNAGLSTEVEVC